MRVALISDIHGNEPALRAVLARIEADDPDVVVCAGDIVGYGPHPAECVDLVRDVADVVVAGNHDRTVDTPERYGGHSTAGPGLRHAVDELDDEQLAWLRNLPSRSVVEGASLLVTHSHPNPDRQGRYVYPNHFENVARQVETDVLVLGHTHVQGADQADGTLVINPGSVGQPRDCDPKAAYALVNTPDQFADLRRVSYDIDVVRMDVEATDLPEQTWRRLRDGT